MTKKDVVWKTESLVQTFLQGIRGGIPFAAEQIDIMLRLIAARGIPVERFLDLGCGNGILSQAILAHYLQAKGILVDFSKPMLKEAKKQLSGDASKLQFVLADFGVKEWMNSVSAKAIPLTLLSPARGEGGFDVIVSGLAIHHQPNKRKKELYAEIFNLLRPGGLFINMEHVSSPTDWLQFIFDEFFIDSLYLFHAKKGIKKSREEIDVEFAHRKDKGANILAPVELQCEWLREIGFKDVDCYFKVFEFAVFGGRRPKS
ncbi:MAG: class I SAM-dependent methyltransferase [Deltaproteobacteria bacterium]|nr:class I SAM-dependent methyltransferase [Deltaproteobacteria bacterium]